MNQVTIDELAFRKSYETLEVLAERVNVPTIVMLHTIMQTDEQVRRQNIDIYGNKLNNSDEKLKELQLPFWERLKKSTDKINLYIVEDILSFPDDFFPHDTSYLVKLSHRLDIEVPKKVNCDWVKNILTKLPKIYYFTLDFNAFVTNNTKINELPGICYYYTLMNTIEAFSRQFCNVIVDEDEEGRIAFCSDDEIGHYANMQKNQENFYHCIHMLLGNRLRLQLNSKPSELMRIFADGLSVVAHKFANYHEYGHILLGHLDKRHSQDTEYQADTFAKTCLMVNAHKYHFKYAEVTLGMTILFFIINLKDIFNNNDYSIYPKAIDRLLIALEDEDEQITSAAIVYWNRLVLGINPTLENYWKIKIDIYEK